MIELSVKWYISCLATYDAENESGALMAMKHSLDNVTSPRGSPLRMVKIQCDASQRRCRIFIIRNNFIMYCVS